MVLELAMNYLTVDTKSSTFGNIEPVLVLRILCYSS